MANPTTGYDFLTRFEAIEVEMDKRFNIFNLAVSQNFNYQNQKFNDINKYIYELNDRISFLTWYINIPWYKKIWYSIRKYNLMDIYEKLNN